MKLKTTTPQNRLPIEHPNYHYSSSLNPYWEKLKNHLYILADNDTEQFQGKWNTKSDLKIRVELGCNGGHFLIKKAAEDPNWFHIGIDWKIKQIYFAGEKAKKTECQNTVFLKAHLDRLHFMFGPQEIDELLLYFPDPWQKKSQKKHRFFQEPKISKIAPLIKTGGIFEIKTDHDDYFIQMIEVAKAMSSSFDIIHESWDKHVAHPNPGALDIPDVTLFEKLFIKKGIKIKSLKLRKKTVLSSSPQL